MDELARIDGRDAFQAALRETFASASVLGWRELFLADADYEAWPLGEPGVIDSLTRWAGTGRHLTLFALGFDVIERRHPRFVMWRRRWAHVITCRALPELQAADVPVFLHAAGALTLRLLDPQRFRGTASRLPGDLLATNELIDAISQRSVEAFPASTLGL